jgi:hypothetical protein
MKHRDQAGVAPRQQREQREQREQRDSERLAPPPPPPPPLNPPKSLFAHFGYEPALDADGRELELDTDGWPRTGKVPFPSALHLLPLNSALTIQAALTAELDIELKLDIELSRELRPAMPGSGARPRKFASVSQASQRKLDMLKQTRRERLVSQASQRKLDMLKQTRRERLAQHKAALRAARIKSCSVYAA